MAALIGVFLWLVATSCGNGLQVCRCSRVVGESIVFPGRTSKAREHRVPWTWVQHCAIVYGDPHATDVDPGFVAAVVDMGSYADGKTTNDGAYLIPDGTEAIALQVCSNSCNASTVHGTSSYHEALSIDVQVQGGASGLFASGSFSLSGSYRQVASSTSEYRTSYTECVAKCDTYQANLVPFINRTLTSGFVAGEAPVCETIVLTSAAGVAQLDPNDVQTFADFVEAFGTHFTASIIMGAKAITRTEFDERSWAKARSTSLDITAAASFSYMLGHGGGSAMSKSQIDMVSQRVLARAPASGARNDSRVRLRHSTN